MIFVTVGTHEQQMNRLIKEIDRLAEINNYNVYIQSGYSDYKPMHCKYKDLIPYQEMNSYMEKSDIIITHGGPGSILSALQFNKIPIVVPRQNKFGEHVDDHQVKFTERLSAIGKIIMVKEIDELERCIEKYDYYCSQLKNDLGIEEDKSLVIERLDKITLELISNK